MKQNTQTFQDLQEKFIILYQYDTRQQNYVMKEIKMYACLVKHILNIAHCLNITISATKANKGKDKKNIKKNHSRET